MSETADCMYVVIHATGERYAIHRGPANRASEGSEPVETTERAEVAAR